MASMFLHPYGKTRNLLSHTKMEGLIYITSKLDCMTKLLLCQKGNNKKRYSPVIYIRFSTTYFENRLLRRVFGPKMEEVVGDWKILH
jgi:hypothetical protein